MHITVVGGGRTYTRALAEGFARRHGVLPRHQPAHRRRRGAPRRRPRRAPELLGLVQAVTAYGTLTTEAALTGRRDVALRALLANPLGRDWDAAVGLLDALLGAHREPLPRFADAPC